MEAAILAVLLGAATPARCEPGDPSIAAGRPGTLASEHEKAFVYERAQPCPRARACAWRREREIHEVRVLVGKRSGGFVCVSAAGEVPFVGWVAAADVRVDPAPEAPPSTPGALGPFRNLPAIAIHCAGTIGAERVYLDLLLPALRTRFAGARFWPRGKEGWDGAEFVRGERGSDGQAAFEGVPPAGGVGGRPVAPGTRIVGTFSDDGRRFTGSLLEEGGRAQRVDLETVARSYSARDPRRGVSVEAFLLTGDSGLARAVNAWIERSTVELEPGSSLFIGLEVFSSARVSAVRRIESRGAGRIDGAALFWMRGAEPVRVRLEDVFAPGHFDEARIAELVATELRPQNRDVETSTYLDALLAGKPEAEADALALATRGKPDVAALARDYRPVGDAEVGLTWEAGRLSKRGYWLRIALRPRDPSKDGRSVRLHVDDLAGLDPAGPLGGLPEP